MLEAADGLGEGLDAALDVGDVGGVVGGDAAGAVGLVEVCFQVSGCNCGRLELVWEFNVVAGENECSYGLESYRLLLSLSLSLSALEPEARN